MRKATGLKESVETLEKCRVDGTVPKTLKVQLPKSYDLHTVPETPAISACVSALQTELLKESLKAKLEKQAAYEKELADPIAAFEREYKELVCFSKLPPDLAPKARSVWQDQCDVFKYEWIKASAAIAAKAEVAHATRTAAAEKAAQSNMELDALPSRELIQDLVAKQVAAALKAERARASSSAPAAAGGKNAGKAKAKAKAQAGSTQGGASGGGKGKQKSKPHAKAPKNTQRK